MFMKTNSSTSETSSTFDEDLNDYQKWIEMEWRLNDDESEDVFAIIVMREDIYERIHSDESISEDKLDRLRKLDDDWQRWLIQHKDPKFRYNFKNDLEPKEKWWWWIDRLDELSETDKKTL